MPAFTACGPTVALSPATASSGATILVGSGCIRVVNQSGVLAFLRTGETAATAATTDLPVPPGNTEVFTKPTTHGFVAVIAASAGTANSFFVTPGEGD